MAASGPIVEPRGRTRFLTAMLGAHLAHAPMVDRASRLAGLPPRSEALVEALRASGVLPGPLAPPIVDGTHDAVCMGVGYVFEGSALGATQLARQLRAAGSTVPPYLARLAAEAGQRWPPFVRRLDDLADHTNIVCAAACNTFQWLVDHLGNLDDDRT